MQNWKSFLCKLKQRLYEMTESQSWSTKEADHYWCLNTGGWQQMKRTVNEMGETEFGWETVYLYVSTDAGWCLFTGVIRQV